MESPSLEGLGRVDVRYTSFPAVAFAITNKSKSLPAFLTSLSHSSNSLNLVILSIKFFQHSLKMYSFAPRVYSGVKICCVAYFSTCLSTGACGSSRTPAGWDLFVERAPGSGASSHFGVLGGVFKSWLMKQRCYMGHGAWVFWSFVRRLKKNPGLS